MTTRINKGETVPGVQRSAWSIRECAATLGVSYNTVYIMVQNRSLRAVKIRGEWRIPDSALQRLLEGDSAA